MGVSKRKNKRKLRIPIFVRVLYGIIQSVPAQDQELVPSTPNQFVTNSFIIGTLLRSSRICYVAFGTLNSICANSSGFRISSDVCWNKSKMYISNLYSSSSKKKETTTNIYNNMYTFLRLHYVCVSIFHFKHGLYKLV